MNKEVKTYESLEPLFNPKSIAVLGASTNPYKIGYIQLKALIEGGFAGDIYPINPKASVIEGLTCYPSITAVPKEVDLAIFCVGAAQIQDSLKECVTKRVKAAIIFASGFAEIGNEGVLLQQHLAKIAKENDIRIIGPNCVGLVNTTNGMIGTFSPAILTVPIHEEKAVGYVSQSGAFGVLTYMIAAQKGLSFNYFVSVGNEMDTTFSDVVEYMIHDPQTKVITGYLEGEKDSIKLRHLAKEALNRNKPIVLMKTGRSNAGSKAAASHTGALAGSDLIYDAFFRQSGIVRVDDYEDIITFSKLFLANRLPQGKNTVLITSSGGRGINEADRCEGLGLNILSLSEKTKTEIKKHIPSYGSAINPIDLTAAASVTNPELYIAPLRALIADPEVHNIIFTEFPLFWEADNPYLQEFIDLCKNSDKFVFITTFPLEGMSVPKGKDELEKNGIPVIPGDLNPMKGLAKLVAYSDSYRKHQQPALQEEDTPKKRIDRSLVTGETLSEAQATDILDLYEIPTTRRAIATTAEEAVQFANSIGYPVVLKIDSADIPHKTEADAIRLNVQSADEVIKAFTDIVHNATNYKADAQINGIAVQEMLPEGIEVIIGATKDPNFGSVVMFGLGGIFVEVFQDISFRVAPLTRADAIDMIEEVKGKALLKGARKKAHSDIEAIIDIVLKVSKLVTENEEMIKEIDINPLIVYENGVKAADAMISMHREALEPSAVRG